MKKMETVIICRNLFVNCQGHHHSCQTPKHFCLQYKETGYGKIDRQAKQVKLVKECRCLGLKEVPFPSCAEDVGIGTSTVWVCNPCDPCLFIRAPVLVPQLSLDTSPTLTMMENTLVHCCSTNKALIKRVSTKKVLLEHTTHTLFEVSEFYLGKKFLAFSVNI